MLLLRECLNDDSVESVEYSDLPHPLGANSEDDQLIEEISSNIFHSEESLWRTNRIHNNGLTSTRMRGNLS